MVIDPQILEICFPVFYRILHIRALSPSCISAKCCNAVRHFFETRTAQWHIPLDHVFFGLNSRNLFVENIVKNSSAILFIKAIRSYSITHKT